jgi:pimeloyl-ACP methyl ester carboxylesterase
LDASPPQMRARFSMWRRKEIHRMQLRVRDLALSLLASILVLAGCSVLAPGGSSPAATGPASEASSSPATAGSSSGAPSPISAAVQSTATPMPTKIDTKVDIGGYSLYLYCQGQGGPTVVFESGLGGGHSGWLVLQAAVAQTTRACSYDRAGTGKSDPSPNPRTSQHIAQELHSLLHAAGVPGPYVLVGHSYGGFNARMFATQYPDETGGVVLVDSDHEDQDDSILAALPTETPDEDPSLAAYRRELRQNVVAGGEPIEFKTSAQQVRASGSLGAIPLIVVSAGKSNFGAFPPRMAEPLDATWNRLQESLTRLSSNSKRIIAENSSHCVQCTQPLLVIDAIVEVVEAVRTQQPLAATP